MINSRQGSISIRIAFCAALLGTLLLAHFASAQNVSMSGEFGISSGRIVNLPLNPPKTACVQALNARCHFGQVDRGQGPLLDPLAEPESGVGIAGAGVQIMQGGLSVGDAFTIPPGVFRQNAGHQFTPIVNVPGLVQLDTTYSFSMPGAARAVNPPVATRVFQENAWSAAGNGQTGRAAATTTPISVGSQSVHPITMRYKAGPNAFGGTMAMLLDGEGTIYLATVALGGSGSTPSTLPWVGTNMLSDGIPNNPNTRYGAGWNYTRMAAQAPGVVINNAGIAPACTVATPPGPAGCGLVTDFVGTTIFVVPGATSTRHLFAWTTGTVEVLFTGTQGGFQADQLLTAMGYDSTSMTTAGSAVRNVGLVAGSFTRRTSAAGVLGGQQVIGLDLKFTPEPQTTAALTVGLGLLALFAGRRSRSMLSSRSVSILMNLSP